MTPRHPQDWEDRTGCRASRWQTCVEFTMNTGGGELRAGPWRSPMQTSHSYQLLTEKGRSPKAALEQLIFKTVLYIFSVATNDKLCNTNFQGTPRILNHRECWSHFTGSAHGTGEVLFVGYLVWQETYQGSRCCFPPILTHNNIVILILQIKTWAPGHTVNYQGYAFMAPHRL